MKNIQYTSSSAAYVNRLFQESGGENISEFVRLIPADIGEFTLREKQTRQGISYVDWKMNWKQDIAVKKTGKYNQDWIQLVFFLNQGFDWEMGDRHTVSMERGEVCIYRDRAAGSAGYYEGGKEFLFKNLQIPTARFRRMAEECMGDREQRLAGQILRSLAKTKITPRMYRLFQEIEQTEAYRGGLADLYLEGKTMELMAACLESVIPLSGNSAAGRCTLSRTDRETVLNVIDRIDSDCVNVPGCEELARLVNMSVSKLARGFRAMTGMSLHAYVIERRLELAAMYLVKEGGNVSQAAIASGYSNMSHFSAAFRRKYGVLPKDYAY